MSTRILLAALGMAMITNAASASFVTLQKNGFTPYAGGTIAGEGVGANAVDYTTVANLADGFYTVDLYHNSGALGSDFGFTLSGGLISAITTGGYGGNPYVIATGVGTTTVSLVPHTITYNANLGQTGPYYSSGAIPYAQYGTAYTGPFLSGLVSVDNLYNSGGGNEDFSFIVDGSGNTQAAPGTGGGPTGIPNSEYATPAGTNLNINHIMAHYTVVASGGITLNSYGQPLLNMVINGTTYDFDMDLTVGNGSFFISSFGSYLIDGGNAIHWDGLAWTDPSHNSGGNDYPFLPMLRYDSTYTNGYDYYFQNGIDGRIATGHATGFYDGDVVPLTVDITATLAPEPASFALLDLGSLMILRRRNL